MEKQKTPGFTQVTNKVLEMIFNCQFTAKQMRLLLLVIRYSKGFLREKAQIPQNKFFEVCGIQNKELNKILNGLQDMKVLERFSRGLTGIQYRVNPNVSQWRVKMALPVRGSGDNKESDTNRGRRLKRYMKELESLAWVKETIGQNTLKSSTPTEGKPP